MPKHEIDNRTVVLQTVRMTSAARLDMQFKLNALRLNPET